MINSRHTKKDHVVYTKASLLEKLKLIWNNKYNNPMVSFYQETGILKRV